MKKEYILVIDSGLGGLSVLAEMCRILPANYIYFADNKRCPYGSHSKQEIINFITDIINKICQKYTIKLVVLACNTATTSAIKELRNSFRDIVFVGTEPAIKLAKSQNYDQILALTTPTTASQNKYKQLKKSLHTHIKTLTMPHLALYIERFLSEQSILNALRLKSELYFIKNHAKNFSCIVLGCTHYVIIKEFIQNITQKPIIDGNLGIAKQVKKCYLTLGYKSLQKSHIIFKSSLDVKRTKQIYKKILSQILANS